MFDTFALIKNYIIQVKSCTLSDIHLYLVSKKKSNWYTEN